jgi:hypothetical protein
MANLIKWGTPGALLTAIDGVTATPTLKNLAVGARVLSNEIATRDEFTDWRLKVRFGTAPTAGRLVLAWFLIDTGDNNEFEDGSDTVEPFKNPDLSFPVRGVTTQQVVALRGIRKPNSPMKILLKNDTNQGFTNTDSENVLSYSLYNLEIQ